MHGCHLTSRPRRLELALSLPPLGLEAFLGLQVLGAEAAVALATVLLSAGRLLVRAARALAAVHPPRRRPP